MYKNKPCVVYSEENLVDQSQKLHPSKNIKCIPQNLAISNPKL